LKDGLGKGDNIFKLELWKEFVGSKDFKDIYTYIEKENEVFRMYFEQME